MYRAVDADLIDIYKAQGNISGFKGSKTYFSIEGGDTPLLHKSGAQLPDKPQVLLKIPTSELLDVSVPRPDWGNANFGREYFVNSFPEWGAGGYRQFMGTTSSFAENWIIKSWGN